MKILKRCRKATIYDDEKNLLCQVNVFLDEEENIRISTPEEFDEHIQETFEVVFFDPVIGLIPCRCALSEPETLSNQVISFKCSVLERREQIQRRMDIKVPVEIDILMRTDGIVGGTIETGDGGYIAKMTDISAGGTFLVSKMWIEKGALIDFEFTGTKAPIDLTVEVLRVMEQTDEQGNRTYGHGCRFFELSRNAETMLRNFVYQRERELYRNDIW